MSKSIEQQAMDIAIESASKWNIEVLDTQFVKEGSAKYLRIYLYKDKGISINDCEKVHRDIDESIDLLDIKDSYFLEVSSLGYDKNLRTKREFELFMGTRVTINLYTKIEKSKCHEGILLKRDDNQTVLEVQGTELTFENENIAKINRVFGY